MSTPSKMIIGLCAAGFALWFTLVVLLNGVPVPGGLFLWYAVVWVPPLFFLLLAYVLVWAMTDLVRSPDVRTPVNVAVAVVGLIGLVLSVWRWYLEMFTPSTGPPL